MPQVASKAAVYFEEEHQALLERLFAQPDDSPQGLRDLVALRLLYDLDIRPGEAIALHLSDLDLARRRVRVHRYKTADEGQYLEFSPALYSALVSYLQCRGIGSVTGTNRPMSTTRRCY